ncbi:MAG: nuclear transport factor 2 family protein [bacterium]
MKYQLLLLVLILNVFLISAQEDDLTNIKFAVTNYYNGYVERDSVKLYAAFDADNGTMKVPVKNEDGQWLYENRYFKDILPVWSNREKLSDEVLNTCQLTIHSMEITHAKLAVAKMTMKVGDKVYYDVLSLQKMNEEWRITNKMYVVLQ